MDDAEAWDVKLRIELTDAANEKGGEATKAQPRSEDGSRLASGAYTICVRTCSKSTNPLHKAKAKHSGTNRGTVQPFRLSALWETSPTARAAWSIVRLSVPGAKA